MQQNCRFEIISVNREENFLPCSTEWDKSVYFTPSNLLPKSVVKMKHLTREQRYGISLMLQEGKSRKDIAKAIGVNTSTISRELRKNCDMRNGTYNYDLAQRKYETRLKLRGRKPVFTKEMKDTVVSLLEEGYSPEQIKGRSNVEGFAMSPMRRCTVGYGKTNARKVHCNNTFAEKGRNTTNVGIPLQEEDTSPIVWI